MQHYLQFSDLTQQQYQHLITRTRWIKQQQRNKEPFQPLKGHSIALIFEKPSTRTRLSFEVGIYQLGAQAIVIHTNDSQLGRGETIADTARVLNGMVDAIVLRTFQHQRLQELADNATVPVINGLSNSFHPCQVLADIYTYIEQRGSIQGKTIAWIGDGNNMANTWLQAAPLFDFHLHLASPPHYSVRAHFLAKIPNRHYSLFSDSAQACTNADLITTDVWTSMGDEAENEQRRQTFPPWQVTPAILAKAHKDALFMHCLPAHRGEEVSAQVIDGAQSVVWQEAENRLHVQKALLELLLSRP